MTWFKKGTDPRKRTRTDVEKTAYPGSFNDTYDENYEHNRKVDAYNRKVDSFNLKLTGLEREGERLEQRRQYLSIEEWNRRIEAHNRKVRNLEHERP